MGRRRKTAEEMQLSGGDVNHPERMKGREPGAKTRRTNGDLHAMPIQPPAWLKPGARRVWFEHAPELVEDGVYDPKMLTVLASYCQLQAEFRWRPHKMATSRIILMTRYLDQFRQGLGKPAPGKGAKAVEDPAEKYFNDKPKQPN